MEETQILKDAKMISRLLKEKHQIAITADDHMEVKEYLSLLANRVEEKSKNTVDVFQLKQMQKNLKFQIKHFVSTEPNTQI